MNQISNLLSFYSYQSNTKVRWQEIKGDINPAERIQMLDSRTARAGSCSAVWWWSILCCSSTSVRGRSWKKLFRDYEESLTIFPVPAAAQDYVLDRAKGDSCDPFCWFYDPLQGLFIRGTAAEEPRCYESESSPIQGSLKYASVSCWAEYPDKLFVHALVFLCPLSVCVTYSVFSLQGLALWGANFPQAKDGEMMMTVPH